MRCPICETAIVALNRDYARDDDLHYDPTVGLATRFPSGLDRPYVVCERRHKHALTSMTRRDGVPDEFELGDYLGID